MRKSIPLTWRKIPERYRMLGVFCSSCSTPYFPSRLICPKCRRKGKLQPKEFLGEGEVYSFTQIFAAPEGFAEQVPYFLALIKLSEGPILTAQVVDTQELCIGDKVVAVFRVIQKDDPEGLIHYGFKFRKAE